jgi:hypothetical protein
MQSYEEKLAPFHSWPARKAVGVATYTLPSRNDFLMTIGAKEDVLNEGGRYDVVVGDLQLVCDISFKYFTEYDLQNLP